MLHLALNTYAHLLMILGVFSSVLIQLVLLRKHISWKILRQLSRADAVYGVTAILVVATGLLNWLYFGKGYEYYANNSLFIIKFSLFILVGLISIYPTVVFARLKKRHKKDQPEEIDIPNYAVVALAVKLELAILLVMPLLATLMANGIDL